MNYNCLVMFQGRKCLNFVVGSGHSLKYHADRNASELWGVDLSHKQIENARRYLSENGFILLILSVRRWKLTWISQKIILITFIRFMV